MFVVSSTNTSDRHFQGSLNENLSLAAAAAPADDDYAPPPAPATTHKRLNFMVRFVLKRAGALRCRLGDLSGCSAAAAAL